MSLSLRKGEIIGLLGPNGAGKSTTMKMITGNLAPTEGSIQVCGIDLIDDPIAAKTKKLVDVTYQSLVRAIKILKPGVTLGDIGYEIQSYVEKEGFSVVKDFCGHGIGRLFHEEPSILHYGKKNQGMKIKEGMVFTIEPMINAGKYDTKVLNDGWTAVTKDKSLSAQFEHTVGITNNGYEVFTLSKNYDKSLHQ